ncbi:hypothetical protein F4553_001634 [Allocatelliglobosispora scoriae]|uniref:HEAT repeat domain-containing protein n=1 Tax=Allocatelliglobosispora scoriae TaxID=643052 RepID=A0A841BKT7_9ACTN|nr:hypothetical protein [Allocatelliglobosispora scoriae]MBB5868255.1 hypothetical protein [Allocatelliglobosispora scoriae]
MPSVDEWTAWRRRVFGDPYLVWHEGAEFQVLLQTCAAEPAETAAMLAAGLGYADHVAAESIAVLAETGRAPEGSLELLKAASATASGAFAIRVAQALRVMTGDEGWTRLIVRVLHTDDHWGGRLDAAMALARFTPTDELIGELGRAVRDPEYLVRIHAADTLLRYAGRKRDAEAYPRIFSAITADREPAWAAIADELTALARAKL